MATLDTPASASITVNAQFIVRAETAPAVRAEVEEISARISSLFSFEQHETLPAEYAPFNQMMLDIDREAIEAGTLVPEFDAASGRLSLRSTVHPGRAGD